MSPQQSAKISAELPVIVKSPVVESRGGGATQAAPPLRCFLAQHQSEIDASNWPTKSLYFEKPQRWGFRKW
jgi:hypothetical protein